MGSFYSSNKKGDDADKSAHNDSDDFYEIKKTKIFACDDFLISKLPKILPVIYEEKETSEVDEHNVDYMEKYQKMKLDDVFGI